MRRPAAAAETDSRLRETWRIRTTLPHPTLSRWERAFGWLWLGKPAAMARLHPRPFPPPSFPPIVRHTLHIPRPSFPRYPTVIPAKAGIHTHPPNGRHNRLSPGHSRPLPVIPAAPTVIPAKAGIHTPATQQQTLRRKTAAAPTVIPAQAGIQNPGRVWRLARLLLPGVDSRFRGNDEQGGGNDGVSGGNDEWDGREWPVGNGWDGGRRLNGN